MEYPFKDLMPLDEVEAREGYYKDWTHIDADTFHQISELVKFIREKGYGSDTREAIAQALERVYHDAAMSGNANMEVSMARKHFKDLASRLDASDDKLTSTTAQLAQKAQQTDLETEKSRIDNLIAVEGNTDNAETADIRVGAYGDTYASAGTAVRSQVTSLESKIIDLDNGFMPLDNSLFELGGIGGTNAMLNWNYRVRSKNLNQANEDITIENVKSGYVLRILYYNEDGSFTGSWGDYTNSNLPYTITKDSFYKFAIQRTPEDSSLKADIGEFVSSIGIYGNLYKYNLELERKIDTIGGLIGASINPTIKFASYNIGHFSQGLEMESTTSTADLYKAYRAISSLDADIVGIVEDLTYTGSGDKYVDSEQTVTSTEFYSKLFSNTSRGNTMGTNVNSVYSDYSLTQELLKVYDNVSFGRYFNHTKCTIQGIVFNVIATHLDWDTTEHRYAQVQELIDYVTTNSLTHVIICGDFNNSVGDNTYQMFIDAGYNLANMGIYGNFDTLTSTETTACYDNIITTNDLRITDVKVHNEIDFSDHFPISATIKILA